MLNYDVNQIIKIHNLIKDVSEMYNIKNRNVHFGCHKFPELKDEFNRTLFLEYSDDLIGCFYTTYINTDDIMSSNDLILAIDIEGTFEQEIIVEHISEFNCINDNHKLIFYSNAGTEITNFDISLYKEKMTSDLLFQLSTIHNADELEKIKVLHALYEGGVKFLNLYEHPKISYDELEYYLTSILKGETKGIVYE